jgi:endonuclease/exonuclease/phosphatase family metal-dependent hydrolase
MLAGWEWDVALLQEVPPWWPRRLVERTGGQQRTARTSRNLGLPLRRALAERRPDLIKSNGGGSNAVLVRGPIAQTRALRLRVWPERRVAQLVRLGDGTVVVNFHGSTRVPAAEQELARLWDHALRFAAGAPLVLGGDLNLRRPRAPAAAEHAAARDVDHVFVLGLRAAGPAVRLERRVELDGRELELSDHIPLAVELSR